MIYKLEESKEEVTVLFSEEAGTHTGGAAPEVRVPKGSQFKEK